MRVVNLWKEKWKQVHRSEDIQILMITDYESMTEMARSDKVV